MSDPRAAEAGSADRIAHSQPVVGRRGAIAAAHPLAVDAGLRMMTEGGSAVDAAIAAHAVIGVTLPDAAGLGGDLLALVAPPDGPTVAVAGCGRSANAVPPSSTGVGGSVTVPGLVGGWVELHRRWGRLELTDVLEPAIAHARNGFRLSSDLATAAAEQGQRLVRGGAGGPDGWGLLGLEAGDVWRQPALAGTLDAVARQGASALYRGDIADAIVRAVARHGGVLSTDDLSAHTTEVSEPVAVPWAGGTVEVQPPPSQGVLLALVLDHLERSGEAPSGHDLVELALSAFELRDDCARGADLLELGLSPVGPSASGRSGPRPYLHTAGVAVADSDGLVVSSLISVFDDFGSAIFVPESGFVLNNRGDGFTTGGNAFGPGRRPVHTLAPIIWRSAAGGVRALATPGADGQVQTLLQVLSRLRWSGAGLAEAIAAARWRSENGTLLVEPDHPEAADLTARGHELVPREHGDSAFGGLVSAGIESGRPSAAADWRRGVTSAAR